MPVLAFPCAIHRLDRKSRPSTRRVWVKGHDFRALAIAATEQLGATPDRCEYSLISPDTTQGPKSALLEVTHADGDVDALLGPMASPLPSDVLLDQRCSLDTLIDTLGLDGLVGRYQVFVTYSPICEWDPPPPPTRQERDVDLRYNQGIDAAEKLRIERSRHQGIHLLDYDVPPKSWTARDLEALLELAYRLLPTTEPRWRESGSIVPAKFVDPLESQITIAPCLSISRGDYVAHLRLPTFPTLALVNWLESRHYEINLRHPMIKPEARPRRAAYRLAKPRRVPVRETTVPYGLPIAS